MKQMKGIRLRVWGALAYGAIMLLGLGWNIWSFQVVMLALFFVSLYEFKNLERLGTGVYYKYAVYVLAAFAVSGFFFLSAASLSFSSVVKFALILGMLHHIYAFGTLWFGKEDWYFSWPSWFRAAMYIGISFGAIFTYSVGLMLYDPWLILFVLFAIWAADIGAFFVGSQWGRTSLHKRLSPKKTVEGLIGGIVSSLLVVVAYSFFRDMSVLRILSFGLVIPLTGTMGDLLVSAYKRRAMVKDSGNVIPGHGGILDRIDAYIYCQPFVAYLLF
jgi:phosphatidate cytidylyltransferase